MSISRSWHRVVPFATVALLSSCLFVPFAHAQDVLLTSSKSPARPAVTELDTEERAILEEAKTHSEILSNLEYLCDNIGPRLTGSARLRAANDWAVQRMKDYGLQNAHLEGYEIPIGWERGPVSITLKSPNEGFEITAAQMAWTPGTHGKLSSEVVVLNVATEEDLNAYKGKLKDAIVLQGVPSEVGRVSEDIATAFPNAPKSYTSLGVLARPASHAPEYHPGQPFNYAAYRAFRTKVSAFLREEGVAAVLLDSGKPHGLLNMTGSWSSMGKFTDGKPERTPLPTFFVTHDHYALLYRLVQSAQNNGQPAPRLEIEAKGKYVKGPITVYNTVGDLVGTEKPNEVVICGAHLDSWDLAQGATDNGTGTCVVLESARLLSKSPEKPKRTIRFILFSGEEEGLFGSQAYVEAHKGELDNFQAALVHDTGTGKVTQLGLEHRDELRPTLESLTDPLKELGFVGISSTGIGPGTDHWSFHEKGVPGFAFLQEGAEYRLTHHSQSDTLDKVRPDDLVQGAEVMSLVALRLADLPDRLPHGMPKQ
jgi:hypothetical protein